MLSQRVGIGLKRLGNQNLITEDCYVALIEAASDVILKNEHHDQLINFDGLCKSKADVVKESFAALLILLVESARHDLDSKVFSSMLENYNFNSKRLNSIVQVYNDKKIELKKVLLQIKRSLPWVIDVNWRLDFSVRSSGNYYPASPVFFIQIVAETCGNQPAGGIMVKKYSFMCSLQELQELVNKLKDAMRHIETVGNIK